MKNILCTGASGFIGRNFLDQDFPKDWNITGTYNESVEEELIQNKNVEYMGLNLSNSKDVEECLGGIKWDLILHLASNTNVRSSIYNPLNDLKSTFMSTFNLVTYCDFKRFVYMSSGAVYNGYKNLVDPDILNSYGFKSGIPYAINKFMSELYIKSVCDGWLKTQENMHKKHYTILRFMGGYGKYENERKFIRKIIKEISFKDIKTLRLAGSGNNTFQLLYYTDMINAINKVVKHGLKSKENILVDLCGDIEDTYTLNSFIKMVQEISEHKIKKIEKIDTLIEDNRFVCDNTQFRNKFNWKQQYYLLNGLEDYINNVRLNTDGF